MVWTPVILLALAGGVGAALANRGVAVFHDGLRPLVAESVAGRMPRRQLAAIAFTMSWGLVAGYGLPFSIASGVVLYHSLWLGTDVIGTWFSGPSRALGQKTRHAAVQAEVDGTPRAEGSSGSSWGAVGAALLGALYGGLLAAVLAGLGRLMDQLPIPLGGALAQLGAPIVSTFSAVPALAIAYQFGVRHGLLALLFTALTWLLAGVLGQALPAAWALAAGMAVLAVYVLWAERHARPGERGPDPGGAGAAQIKRHLPAIAAMGAVYGLICNQAILLESPQSVMALAQGQRAAAIGVTAVRALSFTPLKTMSALATGVFALDGFGFVAVAGLASPHAAVAAVAGALVMSAEALSLVAVARLFERWPALRATADHLRTAMTRLLEVGALVGAVLAANSLAPGLGLLAVAGLYLLNEAAGTPVVRAAMGPVALILFGLAINVAAWLHLVPLP